MGKIFNVLGACALVGSFFAFSACDDEDSPESKLVFEADTFRVQAKVNQIDSFTYEFQSVDKETVLNNLFEQSAKLSKYGNFILDRDNKPFTYGETKLEDVVSEASKTNGMWYFVGSREDYINKIQFDSVKTTFTIFQLFPLDSAGVILAPEIEMPVDYDFEKFSIK